MVNISSKGRFFFSGNLEQNPGKQRLISLICNRKSGGRKQDICLMHGWVVCRQHGDGLPNTGKVTEFLAVWLAGLGGDVGPFSLYKKLASLQKLTPSSL